jgi:hypothetical protein
VSAEIISCPKCGAQIDFQPGLDKTSCVYCKSIVTKPVARVTSLQRMQEAEAYVKRGRNSSEKQSLKFFNMAIELDPDNAQAWIGKGCALLGIIGVMRVDVFSNRRSISEIPKENQNEAEEALRCIVKAIEISGELSRDILEGDTLTIRQELALRLGKWDDIYKGNYKSGF